MKGGVDYAAALSKIETEIQKSQDKKEVNGESEKKTNNVEENDLYNQVIDDECNLVEIN